MSRRGTFLLAAAGLAAPLALNAQSPDLPPRKPGLWEVTTTVEKPRALPPVPAQMCLDAATDREMMDHALKLVGGNCTGLSTRRQGRTYVIEADCKLGGMPAKYKVVISGDFNSAYTLRSEGTTEGAPDAGKAPRSALMIQTATWKSADCPGMRPGVMTMFGVIKVNIKQMKSLPPGLLR